MNMQDAIRSVLEKRDLSTQEMTTVMELIMTGDASPAQIGGFLVGLRSKGESIDEITAAARVMRALATKVSVEDSQHLVDTCGTGGDASGTFNISTAAAIAAAASGAKIAKHGNRSVSSNSGSADVLEAAGVKIDLNADQVAACIQKCGVGFMFAPQHHAAMKYAIGPRREMGVRTIFNVLGPLTNPAAAPNQVLGVFSRDLVATLAGVLKNLGSRHVLVVHGADGLDEISIADETHIAELKDGQITEYSINPEQFGFTRNSLDTIKTSDKQASLAVIQEVFDNTPGPARDIVTLNAGAAIYASGIAASLTEGIEQAKQQLADGSAKARFAELIDISNSV